MPSQNNSSNFTPYGLWSSPITAELLSQKIRLDDLQWDSDGETLVWLEGRSSQGVLVSQSANDATRELTAEQNVRGGVGYGGGELAVRKGLVVFSCRDGRLYKRELGYDQPRPITPPFGNAASPAISPDGRWVAYVFSDGRNDLLGLVDTNGNEWPVKLTRGADFYMQPNWHPGGEKLAWIEWDHPNMPWDGTRLRLGHINGPIPHMVEKYLIAGDEHTPVCQPQFSPDGRWLSYIVGEGEWENLMLVDVASMEKRVLVKGDNHLTGPAWVQGMRSYGWNATSNRLYFSRFENAKASLWTVDLETSKTHQIDISPYTWISQVTPSSVNNQVSFIGSAPSIPDRIIRWDNGQTVTIRRSEAEMIPPDYYPDPQHLKWLSPDGSEVYGLYYPPCNPAFSSPGLPPAIINIHGGPTSQRTFNFLAESSYFTSRGYAWLEVNYRGSSGYGRSYRDALRGRWGDVDVEDAVSGGRELAKRQLADAKRLIIKGGSAGGYTVLNALARYPGIFKAGICLYGVSNLFTLALDTHKFEARYNDSLVGSLPNAADKYHAWSPVFHASRIRDALAIFQGSEDKVVPPSQSEEIVAALRQNGIVHIFKQYEGEGHGFRKNETIADYLQQVERFLLQHVIFAA